MRIRFCASTYRYGTYREQICRIRSLQCLTCDMVQASMFRVSWFLGLRLWWFRSETWQAIIHEVNPLARLCVFPRIRVLLILLDLACFPLIELLCSRPHHDAYTKHARARTRAHTHAHIGTHTRTRTLYDVKDQGFRQSRIYSHAGQLQLPVPSRVCLRVCSGVPVYTIECMR